MSNIKIQDFFADEFPNFAIYNLYRMVASYVDGLKPSQRKIVHTMIKNNITKPMKVSQLAAKVSEQTQYLHGEINLQGVIVNMTQDFTGTNNLNVLYPESSFGNRCFPQAAAARYIFTRKDKIFDKIFNEKDFPLLKQQEFEGDKIEPRFFVPILPMILVNGSEGIGSGWSQKILSRNPKDIKKAILEYIKTGTLPTRIKPWFKDFKGTVNHIENNTWAVSGILKQINTSTYKISEIPPNISLDKFTANLIKLEDNNTITSFTDFSDPGENKFEFEIKVKRSFSAKKTTEQLMKIFHLTKKITENFTCMDENNEVREFKNEVEIFKAYYDIRFKFYKLRKRNIIKSLNADSEILRNKCRFITDIISEKLRIKDLTKAETVIYLEHNDFLKVSGSYGYLINMPIYIISKDQHQKLQGELKELENEIKEMEATEESDMWLSDLKK